MKQVIQNMKTGITSIQDVAVPAVRPGMILIKTAASMVSAGTEKTVVEFAEKSLVNKARSRPDLVRQVIGKAEKEGILPTLEAAMNKLDQPMALGYSSAGVVIDIGEGVENFQVGDWVACAGGYYAVHAEFAVIPQNLAVKIPESVDFESAAFTTLGAIAMQGFRLAQPQVGETIAVIGLGLLGLLSIQIARAAGCRVLGIDVNQKRIELSRSYGIESVNRSDAASTAETFSKGRGFDAVLICAASSSNDPIELASQIVRDKGTIISVGAVGLNLQRKPFFEKEIHFLVSRSYGPGRYDPTYEEMGIDYPFAYVRWTEQRNMESFVDLLADSKVDIKPMISHRIPIEQAADAYELIKGKNGEPFLGVLLTYFMRADRNQRLVANPQYSKTPQRTAQSEVVLGVLGAGNYASATFLPTVKKAGGVTLQSIASSSGVKAQHAAARFGFRSSTSDEELILTDEKINLVALLTRHNDHVRQSIKALHNGKSVYCEKPMAINQDELDQLTAVLAKPAQALFTVGFNRRFASMAVRMKAFFENRSEPLHIYYRINAGALPLNHWLHDPTVGGGRVIGEGCHFIDFLIFLTGLLPKTVISKALPEGGKYRQDNLQMTFSFTDGSIGTIAYLANGEKSFPKERVEVFGNGKTAVLDDFRTLELATNGSRQLTKSRLRQDKGHQASWQNFVRSVTSGGSPPIPYGQLIAATTASFAAVESARTDAEISIPTPELPA